MRPKSSQLQIRVSPDQKSALKRLARDAGQDVSAYVLSRALPEGRAQFHDIVRALIEPDRARFALAELADLLARFTRAQLADATAIAPRELDDAPSLWQNYVAAMVEQACVQRALDVPAWALSVAPLESPHFATSLRSLRLHLVAASPAAFRRRNIFVDAAIGGRV